MCVYNLSNIYINIYQMLLSEVTKEKQKQYILYVTKKENNIYGILIFTVIYDYLFIYYKFHLIYH